MKKQNFAICDLEPAYAIGLMEYMEERKSIPFEILVFSEAESLRFFLKENEVELLLISERMMCEDLPGKNVGRVVILSDGETAEEFTDYPAVYKYQPCDTLVAEVLNYYAHQAIPQTKMLLKKDVRIIGVYSPVGRCGKSSFSLVMGQVLAQKKSVLYVNLEDYAGFERLMGREFSSDITDVLYFIGQNKGNAIFKLNAVVQKLGNMDYIPPAFSAGDLREITIAQWMKFLEDITSVGGYDVVVLDIGEAVEDKFALLSHCTNIYMPVLEDITAKAKVAQYERQVQEMEYEEILEKTEKLLLPFAELAGEGERFWELLLWSEMGEFVRKLLGVQMGV